MNSTGTIPKPCLCCEKPLKGRIDKKFCDDYCRSNYNHKLNSGSNPLIRKINNCLKKNRRILEELCSPESINKVSKQKLIEKAFHFNYHTHTFTNKNGAVYFFCYDYGYLPLQNDLLLIVKHNEK